MDHADIFRRSCPWRMLSQGHLLRCLPVDSWVAAGSRWPELLGALRRRRNSSRRSEGDDGGKGIAHGCWKRPD